VILADASGPRLSMTGFFGALVAVGLAGCWLVRLVGHVWTRGTDRRHFLIAPAGGALLLALLLLDVPLQARWAFARGEFEKVVEQLPRVDAGAAGDPAPLAVPKTIGGYEILSAERVAGGVIFRVTSGCELFDDAGFGWFPDGPDADALNNGSFENPSFSHLRGPWYSWCASW
jgi:hypothetical protein